VRELENIIERAVVLNSGGVITLQDLPEELIDAEAEFDVDRFIPPNMPLPRALERIEERLICRALAQCNNVQSHAAEMLGITKSLIQHKMKKYNIVV
jgi:two-component system NtrC family response regulator